MVSAETTTVAVMVVTSDDVRRKRTMEAVIAFAKLKLSGCWLLPFIGTGNGRKTYCVRCGLMMTVMYDCEDIEVICSVKRRHVVVRVMLLVVGLTKTYEHETM